MIKNKKLYAIIIALLACVSLISVGYASWTITFGSSEANGSITSEDVLFTDKYAKVQEFDPLLYCKYGFVDRNDNNKLSNKGNLKVALQLSELTNFYSKFGCNNVDIELDIRLNNNTNSLDLFNNAQLPLAIKVYDDGNVNEIPLGNNDIIKTNNLITVKLNSNSKIDNDTFYIDLTWTNLSSDATQLKDNWFSKNTDLLNALAQKNLFSFSVKLNAGKGGNA